MGIIPKLMTVNSSNKFQVNLYRSKSRDTDVQGRLSDNLYDSLLLTFQLHSQDFLSTVRRFVRIDYKSPL